MHEVRSQMKVKSKQRVDWQKAQDYVTSVKNIGITKDNQILLNKLVDIQNGKGTSVPKAVHTPISMPSAQSSALKFPHAS